MKDFTAILFGHTTLIGIALPWHLHKASYAPLLLCRQRTCTFLCCI